MLKLKLHYFGHLMQKTDSVEKTLMLGKTEGRRMGRQRMRWLDGITGSMHMSLSMWSWWWTGKPSMLQSMGSQRVRHDWATELNWNKPLVLHCRYSESSAHPYVSQFTSVQFSHSVVSDFLKPHESKHARPPCPSPTPGVHSDSRPSSQWCHSAISSSVVPFSSCPNPSQHQSLFQWVN